MWDTLYILHCYVILSDHCLIQPVTPESTPKDSIAKLCSFTSFFACSSENRELSRFLTQQLLHQTRMSNMMTVILLDGLLGHMNANQEAYCKVDGSHMGTFPD
jgi:hypothetical protein